MRPDFEPGSECEEYAEDTDAHAEDKIESLINERNNLKKQLEERDKELEILKKESDRKTSQFKEDNFKNQEIIEKCFDEIQLRDKTLKKYRKAGYIKRCGLCATVEKRKEETEKYEPLLGARANEDLNLESFILVKRMMLK